MACHSGEAANSARMGSSREFREVVRAVLRSWGVSCN
jgi:hypothetical protein